MALYHTYRSKTLAEVLGQEHITDLLQESLNKKRIHHAYLFTGPRGVGKTSVARILAHAVNDVDYDGKPPEHLDIIEIDAASNGSVEDVRELRSKAYASPVSAKYKVYIIDEVHMLSTAAFNALLKIIEEPPKHVVFIFATTEAHKVPATIVSRSQRFAFRTVDQELLASHLSDIANKEKIKLEPAAASLLAKLGEGSVRDSLSLLDQLAHTDSAITKQSVQNSLGISNSEELIAIDEAINNNDGVRLLSLINNRLQYGSSANQLAEQLVSHWRDSLANNSIPTLKPQILKAGEDLFKVANSRYPKLQLEIILLSLITTETPRQTVVAPTVKTTVTKKQAVKTEKIVETKVNPATTHQSATKPDAKKLDGVYSDEHWDDILKHVKTKNNPVYSALRMARAEHGDDSLHLYFSFPFHKKKLEEQKNKAILIDAIANVSGSSPNIILGIETASDDTMKTVNDVKDILGGEAVSI